MKANQKIRAMKNNDGANSLMFAVISAVLVLAVGLSLTTTVVGFVNSSFAALTGNASAQSLVNIIPIFYVLGLAAASIGIVFVGIRYAGGDS